MCLLFALVANEIPTMKKGALVYLVINRIGLIFKFQSRKQAKSQQLRLGFEEWKVKLA